MSDVEAARRTCDAVVAALSRASNARVPADREVHVRSGLAALARCRALLIGAVELDRAARADVVGVVLRAMLEAWYFGVIVLLGDEHDLKRLEDDNRFWKNDFGKSRPGVTVEPGEAKTFSVKARAKRAGELMHLVGQDPAGPLEWYRDMYAGESLTNAHASPSSIGPYLFVDDADVVGVNHDPEIDEGLRFGRLLLAAGLSSTLGRWVYERSGIDADEIAEIDFPIDGPLLVAPRD